MPASVSMKELLETGVHFGHRTPKWNPRMAPYIFTERNGIHIIDLQQTLANLHIYYDMVRDLVAKGGTVLFVGTKRQAQEAIATEAERCGMPYVNTRWLGGTLTNWRTIRERIETLKRLESDRDAGRFELLTKKERLMLERKIEKLQLRLGGIRNLKRVPDLLFVVDTIREATALKEANILGVPVLALADTNSDPDTIDYILPANDDAVRAIKLLVKAIADAAAEGLNMRKGEIAEPEDLEALETARAGLKDYDEDEEEVGNEAYLGASTIARLRDAALFGDEMDEDLSDEAGS